MPLISTPIYVPPAAHIAFSPACISTALYPCHRFHDAYERGYAVCIASDATGSDDPLHAAITRRYLEDRCTRFVPTTAGC